MPDEQRGGIADYDSEKDVYDSVARRRSAWQSVVVFLSARALGHLGFALSLLAVWLTWLLPKSAFGAPLPSEVAGAKRLTKSPRQTKKTTTTSKLTRPTISPINPAPILATRAVDPQSARHVYFADVEVSTSVAKRNTPAEIPVNSTTVSQVENLDPRTSVILPENISGTGGGPLDVDSLESDSSHTSRNSCKRSHCLPKLKLGFHKRQSDSFDRADQSSVTSTETNGSRRECGNSRKAPDMTAVEPSKELPSFLSFRRRTSSAASNSSTSLTKYPLPTADLLSPTIFVRKSQKLKSVPIPRTMPYGPPYFATPPILLDRRSDMKSQPQFPVDLVNDSRTNDSDSELVQQRKIRSVSLTAAPSTSRKPRSFSADFTKMS